MRPKILTFVLLYLSLMLTGLFAFEVIETSASDIPGQFTATGGIRPLSPATLISLGLFDSNGNPVPTRTNLVPQANYEIRFNIQDTSVFDYRDLSRVTVKMFYSPAEEFTKQTVFGDTVYGSGVTLETTSGGDVFVWEWTLNESLQVNSGIQFEEGLDATISSWSRNINSGLQAPSQAFIDTSGTEQINFDFVIPLQVSKIATLAENRNWHIAVYVEKFNDFERAAYAQLSEYGVTWFGEIQIDSDRAFVWPLVNTGGDDPRNPTNRILFGSDFESSTNNQTSVMVRYISNGNYQHTIQADDVWTANVGDPLNNGAPYTASLVSRTPSNPQEMEIKFSSSGLSFAEGLPNLSSGLQVMNEKNSFTSTLETGDTYDYQLWIRLSNVFQNATYRGTVTLGMRDPFYVILNPNLTDRYYAGTPFHQLANSFGFADTQGAVDQAVSEATTGQTIKILREITADLYIPMGDLTEDTIQPGTGTRNLLTIDFDKHRLNGNVVIRSYVQETTVNLSGLGIINGTLTIDGFRLTVNSDAEVINNTFILDTDLSSYHISEKHHSDIIVGNEVGGRARIVATNNAIDANVVVDTQERVFFEGEFNRITLQNNTDNNAAYRWTTHIRLDNAVVAEIVATEDSEVYLASNSVITSGFNVSANKNVKLFVEHQSNANLSNAGTGTISGVVFLNSYGVFNQTKDVHYATLAGAIAAANTGDIIYLKEAVFSEDVIINQAVEIRGLQFDYRGNDRTIASKNRGETSLTGSVTITASDVTLNGLYYNPSSNTTKKMVVQTGANNTTLSHMKFSKTQSASDVLLSIQSVTGLQIFESIFIDASPNVTALTLEGTATGIQIFNNVFNENKGSVIATSGVGQSLSDFTIRGNKFFFNGDVKTKSNIVLQFTLMNSGLIDDNLFSNGTATSVRLSPLADDAMITNLRVTNNKVFNVIADNNFSFEATEYRVTYSGIHLESNEFEYRGTAIAFNGRANKLQLENIMIRLNSMEEYSFNTSENGIVFIEEPATNSESYRWNNITIQQNIGTNIRNESVYIATRGSGVLSNLLVQDNNFQGTDGGILILSIGAAIQDRVENLTIQHNTIDADRFSTSKAIELFTEGQTQYQSIQINNNTLDSDGITIQLYASGAATYSGINILNNTRIDSAQYHGISLDALSNAQWDYVTISGNSFLRGAQASLLLKATNNAAFRDIQVANNVFSSQSSATAIRVALTSGQTTLERLSITGNDLRQFVGLEILNYNVTPALTLTNNSFNANNYAGWYIRDLSSNTLPFFTLRDDNSNSFTATARMSFDDAGFINGVRPDTHQIFPIVTTLIGQGGSGLGFSASQLQLAVDQANEGDTVTLRSYSSFFNTFGAPNTTTISSYNSPNIYLLSSPVLVRTSGLTIQSNPAPVVKTDLTQAVLRNAGANNDVIIQLQASGITLSGLTFYRENATGSGGSILVQGSHATLQHLRFISNASGGIPVHINNTDQASLSNITIENLEIGSGVITGTSVSGSSNPVTNAIPTVIIGEYTSGLVIQTTQNGLIDGISVSGLTLTGSGLSDGVVVHTNSLGQISGLVIQESVIQRHARGVVLPSAHTNTLIQNNVFTANTIHWVDAQTDTLDVRRVTLDANVFVLPEEQRNAATFVAEALILGNTITSQEQTIINSGLLEAYSTLQEAIDDASDGDTILLASNTTFSVEDGLGVFLLNKTDLTLRPVVLTSGSTIVHSTTSENSGLVTLDITASGVQLENITIERDGASGPLVRLQANDITLSGLTLSGVSPSAAAILITNEVTQDSGLGIVLRQNLIQGQFGFGVLLENHVDTANYDVTISDNQIIASMPSGLENQRIFYQAIDQRIVRLPAFESVTLTNNLDESNQTIAFGINPVINQTEINTLASLNALVTTSGLNTEKGDYTNDSFIAVQTAFNLVQNTPTEISAKITALQTAIDALVFQASFDALVAIQTTIAGLIEADYTVATWTRVTTASGLSEANDADVITKTTALTEANLYLLRQADVDALTAIVSATSGVLITEEEADFTAPTWNALEEANTSGMLLLGQIEANDLLLNSLVTTRFSDLQTAIESLVFSGFALLETTLDITTSGLSAVNYTEATYDPFIVAQTSGLSLRTQILTAPVIVTFSGTTVTFTQAQVVTATDDLLARFDALVFSGMAALIEQINLTSGLVANNFTTVTYEPYDAALQSGLSIVTLSGTAKATFEGVQLSSARINEITIALSTNYQALVYSGLVELQNAVTTASGLTPTDYTNVSWDALVIAITSGQQLLDAITAGNPRAVLGETLITSDLLAAARTDIETLSGALVAAGFLGQDGVYYGTFNEVLAASNNFDTITLTQDIILGTEAISLNKVNLDFNTYTITFTQPQGQLRLNPTTDGYSGESLTLVGPGLIVGDNGNGVLLIEGTASNIEVVVSVDVSGITTIQSVDGRFTFAGTHSGVIQFTSTGTYILETITNAVTSTIDVKNASGLTLLGAQNEVLLTRNFTGTSALRVESTINTLNVNTQEPNATVITLTSGAVINHLIVDQDTTIVTESGAQILSITIADGKALTLDITGDVSLPTGYLLTSGVTTKAATEVQLFDQVANPNVTTIFLDPTLVVSGLSEFVADDVLTLDFGQKRLVGNLVITTPFSGVVELGSGLVVGDLTASGLNATFNNNLTVTGTIFIQAVSMNTWNQFGDANGITMTANGGSFNYVSGVIPQGFTVSGNEKTQPIRISGNLTTLPISIDVASDIEFNSPAGNVTITATLSKLTLNANVALRFTATGDVTTFDLAPNASFTIEEGLAPSSLNEGSRVSISQTGQQFSTIQAAIDAAQEGAIILVQPGLFNETIELTVSGMTLQSTDGSGVTTIKGKTADEVTVSIKADNVTIDGFTIDNDSGLRAIAPRNSRFATITNNVISNSLRGVQGDYFGVPHDLTITNNLFQTDYGVDGTDGMLRLYVKNNQFETPTEGIGLREFVTIAQESTLNNGLRRLVDSDWSEWLIANNSGLAPSSGVVDYRNSTNLVFEGSTRVQDVTFTSGTSYANFDLTYNLDNSGFITGSALASLNAQKPGPGGINGYGYGSVGISRPNDTVTHVSVTGFYNSSAFNSAMDTVKSFGGVTGKYWYVYLAREVNPDTLIFQNNSGYWLPFRDGDTYFFTVTWYTTIDNQQVFHSREHILVTIKTPSGS